MGSGVELRMYRIRATSLVSDWVDAVWFLISFMVSFTAMSSVP